MLSWILGSVSKELYSCQIFSENALVVWNELNETYNKIDESIIFNLHNKSNSLKQSGSTISYYYHKMNNLWKQYGKTA